MALSPQSTLSGLIHAPMRSGRVVWIGLRPARGKPLRPVDAAAAQASTGLLGDHYETRNNGHRQVTLVSAEHLQAVASFLGREAVDPGLLRRNVLVAGINLLALKEKQFRVGEAVLEYSGECQPCSRMEETLGVGGYNAVRGHGGITARVISAGEIRVGDSIEVV